MRCALFVAEIDNVKCFAPPSFLLTNYDLNLSIYSASLAERGSSIGGLDLMRDLNLVYRS